MHLGAVLAAPDRADVLLPQLSVYGLPLGDAFQMRDDVMGAFGDAEVTGKPVGGDLIEGKPTPLLARAVARADADQRAVLDLVGDPALAPAEVEQIQQAIVATGALDELEAHISALTATAIDAIGRADVTDEAKVALVDLAHYVSSRDRLMRVVVIGAGLGGLSAAAHLSNRGHDITIVEREPHARRSCRDDLISDGFRLDNGPTVLTMPDLLADAFDAAGATWRTYVTIKPVDPMYRAVYADGSTLFVRHGREAMTEEIRQFSRTPKEADGVRTILRLAGTALPGRDAARTSTPTSTRRSTSSGRGVTGSS